MLIYAINLNDLEEINQALENGENPFANLAFNGEPSIPLAIACATPNIKIEIIKALLAKKQNLIHQDMIPYALTCALDGAVKNKRSDIVQLLLDAGAKVKFDIYDRRDTPLHIACQLGSKEIVQQLLQAGADVEHVNVMGETPVFKAVEGFCCGCNGNTCSQCTNARETLQILMQSNPNLQHRDRQGANILMHCGLRLPNVVQILKELHIADINAQDSDGISALMQVCNNPQSCDNREMIYILVAAGASVTLKDNNERSAVDRLIQALPTITSEYYDAVAILIPYLQQVAKAKPLAIIEDEFNAARKSGYALEKMASAMIPTGYCFSGRFGQVISANYKGLVKVAVKTLMSVPGYDIDVALEKEKNVLARIGNAAVLNPEAAKHVVTYRGYQGHSLCFEWVGGGTLKAWIANKKAKRKDDTELNIEECSTNAYQMAHGLAFLHANQIVHRDLKPDNIGFRVDGSCVILDFGHSIVLDPEKRSKTWKVEGNAAYSSPEALSITCELQYTTAHDIYGLGVMFAEMITCGRYSENYRSVEDFAFWVKQFDKRPQLPAHCPANISSLAASMWHKNPSERITAAEVVEKLKPAALGR